jgi:hypothetical protein
VDVEVRRVEAVQEVQAASASIVPLLAAGASALFLSAVLAGYLRTKQQSRDLMSRRQIESYEDVWFGVSSA